jgi:hypothetical protein
MQNIAFSNHLAFTAWLHPNVGLLLGERRL